MKFEKQQEITLPTGVLGLAAAPDGSRIHAACVDGFIHTATPDGRVQRLAEGHDSYASGCVLLPDGRTLISGGYDGCLLWHDVDSGRCFRRVRVHDFWSWQLALSPDGSQVASVTGQYLAGSGNYEPAPESEPSIVVLDTRTGDVRHRFSHLPPVLSVAFSRDGRHLAAGNLMGDVRIHDLSDPARPPVAFRSDAFTSWGSIKSHHYCGGIYGLAFSPDDTALVCCGMGPMTDPMAGNGRMTWQRWAWRETPPREIDRIREGEHGSGLMETLAWHPDGKRFIMAGRQAQGTWNVALFNAEGGTLAASLDTKNRVTRASFLADGSLWLAACNGQPGPKADGHWPAWGRLQRWSLVS